MVLACSTMGRPLALHTQSRAVARPLTVSRTPAHVAARSSRLVVRAAVVDEVRSIIAEQLGMDLSKVAPDSKFVDLGADSLDTVEIMMALEEKFDIQLDEEGAEKIATVHDAAQLIEEKVKA